MGEGKAQEEISLIPKDTVKAVIDPNRPARAAFYSALVPGLGQAYNKKYWKIPIVYAGLGAGIYYYTFNQNKYHEYRDEYKRRLDMRRNNKMDNSDQLFKYEGKRGKVFEINNNSSSETTL